MIAASGTGRPAWHTMTTMQRDDSLSLMRRHVDAPFTHDAAVPHVT